MKKLTPRAMMFVDEYLIDLNGTYAAIRAGFAPKNAKITAYKLLKDPRVIDAIDLAKKERIKRLGINKDYVLSRLIEIDKMDALDILKDDGTVKPVNEWPLVWRQFICGMDISELASGDTTAIVKKIKWPDKVKNLELIGRHVDIQAFKDKLELGVDDGLADRLARARERAKNT